MSQFAANLMAHEEFPPDLKVKGNNYHVNGEIDWDHIIAAVEHRKFLAWRNLVVLAISLTLCFIVLAIFAYRHATSLTIAVSLATAIAVGSSLGGLFTAVRAYRQISAATEALYKVSAKDAAQVISFADKLIETGKIP